MRVLITGGTGLLGRALIATRPPWAEVVATVRRALGDPSPPPCVVRELDVTDRAGVAATVAAVRPDWVVHTASIDDVDYTETHPDLTREVNVGGTENVVCPCAETDARLAFISSNAVFDGLAPPYGEEDPTSPVNQYGKLKVEGEQLVLASGVPHLLIRPILMYGWNHPRGRPNPATWLMARLGRGEQVRVVDDVFSNPIFADHCAQAIWRTIELDQRGCLHLAGRECLSRYEFARTVARVLGTRPVSVEEGLQRMQAVRDWRRP